MGSEPTAPQGASYAAIQHHYDVSNDFYATWLGPSMAYSCALWDDGDDLEAAQVRKFDHHLREACVQPGSRVLDVGCGWGGLMDRALTHWQASQCVGLTLSKAQHDWMAARPMPGRQAHLQSWEEHGPDEQYDAIVSVGAFEHFARLGLTVQEREEGYRAFFEKCHAWLRPGGRLSLQTIACGNMLRSDFSKFFELEIFPESDLPRLPEIYNASEFLFEPVNMRNDRLHYARTVRAWKSRLADHREAALRSSSPEVLKRYETYLDLVILAFDTFATMNLYRITLQRIDRPRHWRQASAGKK